MKPNVYPQQLVVLDPMCHVLGFVLALVFRKES